MFISHDLIAQHMPDASEINMNSDQYILMSTTMQLFKNANHGMMVSAVIQNVPGTDGMK